MRILVTGATGYVGLHVAVALRGDGHDVVGMSRAADGARQRDLLAHEVELLHADLSRPESYRDALRGVDAVVHAALVPGDALAGDLGLIDEVLAAKDAGARGPHLVYTSGFSVYGDHELDVVDEATPVAEQSFRGRVEARLAESGLPYTSMRLGFVYGLDSRHSPLGDWFAQAERGECVHFGREDKRWSWIHVGDAARAYALLLRDPAAHEGEAYCLVDDAEPALALSLHEQAARAAGYAGETRLEGIEAEAPDLRVFDRHEAGRNEKAKQRLGWEPRHAGPAGDLPRLHRAWAAART